MFIECPAPAARNGNSSAQKHRALRTIRRRAGHVPGTRNFIRAGCSGTMSDHNKSLAIVARNSGWNLVAFGITIAANLILLTYVVKLLGMVQFGISGILVSVSIPFTLIGTTLSQAACQGIARHRARGDWAAVRGVCATTSAIGILSVAAGAIVLGCLVFLISGRLLQPAGSTPAAIWLVTLTLVIGSIAQQASLLMQGIHVACMAYRRIATINAIGTVLRFSIVLATIMRFRRSLAMSAHYPPRKRQRLWPGWCRLV